MIIKSEKKQEQNDVYQIHKNKHKLTCAEQNRSIKECKIDTKIATRKNNSNFNWSIIRILQHFWQENKYNMRAFIFQKIDKWICWIYFCQQLCLYKNGGNEWYNILFLLLCDWGHEHNTKTVREDRKNVMQKTTGWN